MAFNVILTRAAEKDFDDLYDYIANSDSIESAEYVAENIKNVIRGLSSFPNRGVFPREISSDGINKYREIFFKPYRIVYKVDGERQEVHIFVIADGRRDMKELLKRRLSE